MIRSPPDRIADYTARGWWGDATLHGLLDARGARSPDAEAVVDPADRVALTGEPPARLTYGALRAKTLAFAASLARHGIARDDVVVAQLPNTHEAIALLIACARIGAILSPIALQFRASELAWVLESTAARVFVTMARVRGFAHAAYAREHLAAPVRVLAFGAELPAGVERFECAGAADFDGAAAVTANDVVTLCWTSGTESRPKGVPRSHNQWLAVARAKQPPPPDEVYLCAFPLVAMASIGGQLVPWLQGGGRFVLHHPFDLQRYLAQIREERVTYTSAPPAILLRMLDARPAPEPADLASLRAIGSGAAPLPTSLAVTLQERYGIELVNNFGSNEGCAIYASRAEIADPALRATHFPAASWRPGPGRYAGGVIETRLIDRSSGADVTALGVAGELAIRGPTLFDGYWAGPGRFDRGAFDAEGFFRTGDLLERVAGPRGPLYRFVGRAKEIIVRGGMKISPAEIEEHLARHPLLVEAACVGLDDPILGERVAAVVVPRDGAAVGLADVTEFLRARGLAMYKLPERLCTVAALPRNPNSKVIRAELRRILAHS